MAIIIKTIMSGLTVTTALAVIGASASAALKSKDLGLHQTITQQVQEIDKSQPVKVAWSQQDQQKFWEQQGDRG